MKPQARRAGWWLVFGTTVTAIVMAATPGADGSVVQATRATSEVAAISAPVRRAGQAPHVELERLQRPQERRPIGNAFAITSWYVPPPPPPPPPPAAPVAPTAPPLPFTYIGRYEDAPTQLVILLRGEHMYTVSEGEVIENTYRVEHVTPAAVELVYLPLNIKQTLKTGESS
ncbi:MAG: hypothetical protein PHH36_05925 [Sideroxydans sp.]|nr:hypothetical protein [Sideroxydans sp.]